MAIISNIARNEKLKYFFNKIPRDAHILEIGCADGWVGRWAVSHGWKNFVGIDLVDTKKQYSHDFVVGDVNDWSQLGFEKESFDCILAFEVVEHGNFYKAMRDLLKSNGKLFITTPVPHMDWLCKIFELLKLNQRRTSKHSHLIYMKDVPYFQLEKKQIKGFMSQWGEFVKASF